MQIAFRLKDGSERKVDAPAGQSLMRAAVTNGVPGIEGECNGELNCGTCHVVVEQHWWAHLSGRSDDEDAMIEFLDRPSATSRLSCQITLGPELEGLIVDVPEE